MCNKPTTILVTTENNEKYTIPIHCIIYVWSGSSAEEGTKIKFYIEENVVMRTIYTKTSIEDIYFKIEGHSPTLTCTGNK